MFPRRCAGRPFGKPVEPGGMMSVAWKFLARLGLRQRRDSAAVKDQLAPPDYPARLLMRARHRDQPARSLDHHALPVGDRRRDQRDPRVGIAARELAHPFGARARLAEPAPRLDQPDTPVARRPALAGLLEPRPAGDPTRLT